MKKSILLVAGLMALVSLCLAFASCDSDSSDPTPVLPGDALSGVFTVNAEGKTVHFSKGNLQATINVAGVPTAWKFAEKQYDYLGEDGANKSIGIAGGDIDLFGWSTDGTGATPSANYKPWGINNSTDNQNYSGDFKEWGSIESLPGNSSTTKVWRTLTKDEWVYLFNTRTSSTIGGTENARFAKVKVAGKAGILLFPDVFEWTGDMGTAPSNYNDNTAWENVSNYSTAEFEAMEAAGCVFLPAAGRRHSGSDVRNVGSGGYYWSATHLEDSSDFAYDLYFNDINVVPASYINRYYGQSVRLVCGEN